MDIVIRMVNTVGLYRSKYVGPRPIVEHKLEMNCDFSSNNIMVGLSFMSFLAAILNFVECLLGILPMDFLAAIFRIQKLNFKFQTSETPLKFCTFKLIYICLSNGSTFRGPSKHLDLYL